MSTRLLWVRPCSASSRRTLPHPGERLCPTRNCSVRSCPSTHLAGSTCWQQSPMWLRLSLVTDMSSWVYPAPAARWTRRGPGTAVPPERGGSADQTPPVAASISGRNLYQLRCRWPGSPRRRSPYPRLWTAIHRHLHRRWCWCCSSNRVSQRRAGRWARPSSACLRRSLESSGRHAEWASNKLCDHVAVSGDCG